MMPVRGAAEIIVIRRSLMIVDSTKSGNNNQSSGWFPACYYTVAYSASSHGLFGARWQPEKDSNQLYCSSMKFHVTTTADHGPALAATCGDGPRRSCNRHTSWDATEPFWPDTDANQTG
eukprot:2532878-Rhodomonas_salina.1